MTLLLLEFFWSICTLKVCCFLFICMYIYIFFFFWLAINPLQRFVAILEVRFNYVQQYYCALVSECFSIQFLSLFLFLFCYKQTTQPPSRLPTLLLLPFLLFCYYSFPIYIYFLSFFFSFLLFTFSVEINKLYFILFYFLVFGSNCPKRDSNWQKVHYHPVEGARGYF